MENFYQKIKIFDGNRHTALTREEGEFLYKFIKKEKINKTLEIGMGFAVSSIYIMQATEYFHYAIDPYQNSEKFKNHGIRNIEKFGLKRKLKFLSQFSALALPELVKKNKQFELILMDGSHKFDDIFVDFYFCDLLLKKNGFILLHDSWSPQIKTLESWIDTNKKSFDKIKTECDSFVVYMKISDDKRKWFDFSLFKVCDKGNISRFF